MRSLKTMLLLFLSQSILLAQEFAPIGAVWHVEVVEPFQTGWTGVLTNESIRDTIIRELDCKVLFKNRATIFNEIFGEYCLCQSGDSIFHYIESLDSLNLVMDFGAEVGESWVSFDQAGSYESFGFEQNFKYQVDSIGTLVTSNNVSLRVQYLTEYQKLWSEPDSLYRDRGQRQLIEKIGFQRALLPRNDGDGFTDDIFETRVRCYQDNLSGLIKLTEDNNCITSSTVELREELIKVFPNPTEGILHFKYPEETKLFKLNIYDSKGQLVLSTRDKQALDLSPFSAGIYFLKFSNQASIFTERILLTKH